MTDLTGMQIAWAILALWSVDWCVGTAAGLLRGERELTGGWKRICTILINRWDSARVLHGLGQLVVYGSLAALGEALIYLAIPTREIAWAFTRFLQLQIVLSEAKSILRNTAILVKDDPSGLAQAIVRASGILQPVTPTIDPIPPVVVEESGPSVTNSGG